MRQADGLLIPFARFKRGDVAAVVDQGRPASRRVARETLNEIANRMFVEFGGDSATETRSLQSSFDRRDIRAGFVLDQERRPVFRVSRGDDGEETENAKSH